MNISFFFYILFFSAIFLTISSEAQSPPLNCSNGSPLNIHFPFSKNCSNTSKSFQLYCKNTTTMIHFPTYGDLIVKSISYNDRKLQLADPNSCVHEVFLNLNLSLTPFRYYYVVKNYTYLNCSTRLSNYSPSFVQIPCLSGSKHHVYSVDESSLFGVPDSCNEIKSVAIPFSFSPYLDDNSFGLAFTWSLPESEQQSKGLSNKQWSLGDKLVKIVLCLILALALLMMKMIIYDSRKVDVQIQKSSLLEGILL